MGKSIHMVTSDNNNTGTTLRKVSESPNGDGPPPIFFNTGLETMNEETTDIENVGFFVGGSLECGYDYKKLVNEKLNEKGMRATSRGMDDQGRWVTHNTHPSGARIDMTVLGKSSGQRLYRFHRGS